MSFFCFYAFLLGNHSHIFLLDATNFFMSIIFTFSMFLSSLLHWFPLHVPSFTSYGSFRYHLQFHSITHPFWLKAHHARAHFYVYLMVFSLKCTTRLFPSMMEPQQWFFVMTSVDRFHLHIYFRPLYLQNVSNT